MFFRKKRIRPNYTRLSVDVPDKVAEILSKTAADQGATLDGLLNRLLFDSARTFAPALLEGKGPRAGEEETPVVRLVNMLLSIGIDHGATEIYLVPTQEHLVFSILRPGVNGGPPERVTEFDTPFKPGVRPMIIPKHIQRPAFTRLKWMARLDILKSGEVQEGRIPILHNGRPYDIVVEFAPAEGAEDQTEEQVTLYVQPKEAAAAAVAEATAEG